MISVSLEEQHLSLRDNEFKRLEAIYADPDSVILISTQLMILRSSAVCELYALDILTYHLSFRPPLP